jgi:hypothetical protein
MLSVEVRRQGEREETKSRKSESGLNQKGWMSGFEGKRSRHALSSTQLNKRAREYVSASAVESLFIFACVKAVDISPKS